ncbi:hypothetical protein ACS0TY_030470 [Phlomoides rotata]
MGINRERSHKELTPSDKKLIAQFLIANITNGVVHRGKQAEMNASFGVALRTVQYVWSAAKQQEAKGEPDMFINNKKRSTIRRLAKEMGCSKSVIY